MYTSWAMVARFVGAGDEKSANRVAQQAFVVGIILSLVVAAIGHLPGQTDFDAAGGGCGVW